MRRITKSIAVLAMAAGATLGTATAATAATTTSGSGGQNGLVNVYLEDVLTGNQVNLLNNVAVPVVANVCGIDVDVLSSELLTKDKVACLGKSTALQKAWIVNS